jgi:hypothetical protein
MVMRKAVGFAVAATLFSAVLCTPGTADADTAVSGTGKGIAGGALLGGEVGFMALSAFGAKSSWMYWTIPTALAIGGGVGGYFIEKSASPEIPLAMLAGGMALIIPTVVITLSAASYQPTSEDSTPADATPAEPGKEPVKGTVKINSAVKSKISSSDLPVRPFALVNYVSSSLVVAMPVISLAPSYTRLEQEKFGVAQHYELRAPIASFAF